MVWSLVFKEASFTASPFSITETKYSEQRNKVKEATDDSRSAPHQGADEKEAGTKKDSWKDWDEG